MLTSMKFRSIITVAILLVPISSSAQNALLNFTTTMFSFSADFTQTVYDSDSVALQESAGSVELLRPGRFRWTYTEPNSQLIVADGVTVWVYDEDIKQVTAQPQSVTLGSAPIGLLSGQRSIVSDFEVTELGEESGLLWFELTPFEQDTDFNNVYIALDENGLLQAMELRDNFEQATQIKFIDFKKNITIDAERFTFVPPDDADVIGEVGTESPPEPVPVTDTTVAPANNNAAGETSTGGATEPADDAVSAQEQSTADSAVEDPDEIPIIETEPLPETNTVIDGNDIQFEEITN